MKTITLVLALSLAAGSAMAAGTPYQWRDASGHMVYSDQPPPREIRQSQILRRPKATTPGTAEQPLRESGIKPGDGGASAAAAPSGAPVATAKAPAARKTIAEREIESNKRRAAEAEARKKQDEAAILEQKKARACDDMRASLRTLESGARVKTVGENGVQRFVGDLERAQRVAELQRSIADDCAAQ
ncbi:MAG: DUF4124 domain-containing protein [Burkholderiaceae bacterium]|nr:DUF4124 domain-containing protein [Burkholderiaceae bacterium]